MSVGDAVVWSAGRGGNYGVVKYFLDEAAGVRYQAFNMLADNPNQPLWPAPRSAADIYANGVFVAFGFPNESQFLRLRKVP